MPSRLSDILGGRQLNEPPEIRPIKKFIRDELSSESTVRVSEDRIVISVPNAALAGALRMHIPKLQKISGAKKRLIIRIGL